MTSAITASGILFFGTYYFGGYLDVALIILAGPIAVMLLADDKELIDDIKLPVSKWFEKVQQLSIIGFFYSALFFTMLAITLSFFDWLIGFFHSTTFSINPLQGHGYVTTSFFIGAQFIPHLIIYLKSRNRN